MLSKYVQLLKLFIMIGYTIKVIFQLIYCPVTFPRTDNSPYMDNVDDLVWFDGISIII